MPVISVLTASDPSRGDLVLRACTSVEDQVLPSGWQLEWILQEDGAAPTLLQNLPEDDRIKYSHNDQKAGIAVTRNLGLVRASGSFGRVLDDDEFLVPFLKFLLGSTNAKCSSIFLFGVLDPANKFIWS